VTSPQSLAQQIDIDGVRALLVGRPSDVLTAPDRQELYYRTVTGVASEVVAVVGLVPPEQVREMAVWCVCLGVAASLESSLYPEQQLGDESRARELRTRFLGVLASLRTAMVPTERSTGVDLAGSYSTSGMYGRALDAPFVPYGDW